MLDNLVNPDLSGVSGYIRYSYDSSMEVFPQFLLVIIFGILAVGLLMICFRIVNGSKSKQYRELLSDMYVAGRVKQIAKKDDIDLTDELKKFGNIVKKSSVNMRSIDEVVSLELREKIQEESDKVRDDKAKTPSE